MHTYIITGLVGWASNVRDALLDEEIDCELNEKGWFVVAYNTSEGTIRDIMERRGFSGGKIIKVQ